MVPVTEPEAVEDEIVPPLSPTKPPAVLFGPMVVTAPVALEAMTSPGPFPKTSVPMKPPSTLLPPPVTVPIAELERIVPSPVPTKPPATLASPTVTLPRALDPAMMAVSFAQPAQLNYLQNLRRQIRRRCCRRPPAHSLKRPRTESCRNCCPRGRRPAGSQYSGPSHIAARKRVGNHALTGVVPLLICTNKATQCCDPAGAGGAGDISGRECIGDGAAVEACQSAGSAVDPNAHRAAGARWPAAQSWVRLAAAAPVIVPEFFPARPPTKLSAPPLTSPVAEEPVTVCLVAGDKSAGGAAAACLHISSATED